jgi:N-acetylglutamate synthase-like GNAT family acetyltransferase
MSSFRLAEVVRFTPQLASHFESLNREWIEKYFEIEEGDLKVFRDPFKEIVQPGGQIFFVIFDGEVLGTCAVMKLNAQTYELAKMAVSTKAQGRGYSKLLMISAIEFARENGAERLILLSNTRLGAAIALYEKFGFRSVPITDAEEYKRVDIQMELQL